VGVAAIAAIEHLRRVPTARVGCRIAAVGPLAAPSPLLLFMEQIPHFEATKEAVV
jgi:hypothetical protein